MKTRELKTLLDRIETWPKEAREELLRSMGEIETRYSKVYHVNDDERSALKHSAADVQQNRFANDSDVKEVFSRFHRA